LGFLGRLDYGVKVKQITTMDEPPNGGNMAFKRSALKEVGGFDPTLGRKGVRSLSGGEEPELFERFLAKQFSALYQPDAVVYHVIDQWRMRKFYFRKVHFVEGQMRGRDRIVGSAKNLLGIPLFLGPQLARSLSELLSSASNQGWSRSLRKEMNVWYLLGFMIGCAQHKFRLRS
jgi:hypothetical protein